MKKFFATTMAILMTMAIATTAFAADGSNSSTKKDGESQSIPVDAKYNGSVTTPGVVSVQIEWGKMEFTYNVGGTKDWNAKDHTYDDNSTEKWTEEGNTIKLTNHSNVDVKATFTYQQKDNSVSGDFTYNNNKTVDSEGAITLNKGVENHPESADNVTATLKLSGKWTGTSTKAVNVGSVIVSIAK